MIKNKSIMKIVLLLIISLVLTSCSSMFEPNRTFTPYDLVGAWRNRYDRLELFVITKDGIITFYNADGSSSSVPISNWNRIKYVEDTWHEFVLYSIPILGNVRFVFMSDSECEVFYGNNGVTSYYEKL
ncbi:hypothetical protein R4K55_01875 [Brachyspira alvinipulli]|uniref:hypothetical protein n=1 Tax=Brachyspira alvinipulli TaxID=84379 RepID=UPI002638C53D|nr:hypothetical protein [uncultured Brachyspira sp.]